MLMLSVFVQNIVNMIVDYALWVAVLNGKSFRRSLRADCSKEPDEQIESAFNVNVDSEKLMLY